MSRPLWTLEEIVAAVGPCRVDGPTQSAITGLSIDSRTLVEGDLFVALKDARDGHTFVPAALANGAVAALVARDYQPPAGHGPWTLIRVDDPLAALQALGRAARARLDPSARVIAVTGSAGKTGTKEMLRVCLEAVHPGRVHASQKSYNNHWGVPLTLALMPADTAISVFEVGMNHAGEISPLTRMVRPHVALITNVLPVHVGNFPDGEVGVANAKAEIFEGLEPGGIAILPRDNPHFDRLRVKAEEHDARLLTFGVGEDNDAHSDVTSRWTGDTAEPIDRVHAVVRKGEAERSFDYNLGMPGSHIATNSLAVLLALDAVGCLSSHSLKELEKLRPPPGRGARLRLDPGGILLIDESYNANPRSVAAALGELGQVPRQSHARRIAILGDMLELGETAAQHHTELRGPVDQSLSAGDGDLLLACGPNMRLLFDAVPEGVRGAWAPTSAELIDHVLAAVRTGDVVMVKGSLGSRMAPIVEALKSHFGPPAAVRS